MKSFMKQMLMDASFFALCCMTLVLTSCDAHQDFPDTTTKICDILCTDGKVVSQSQFDKGGKEAIAVVYYVNHREDVEGQGFAVYLWDTEPATFADSLGVKQGTSASVTAFDGNANTYALFTAKDVSSTMASNVFDMWRYGQSAYVPSVAQMQLLFNTRSQVNAVIAKLGGEPIPDDPDECWYWTSTEVEHQESVKAWLYSLSTGTYHECPKDQSHKVRPIVTIYQ